MAADSDRERFVRFKEAEEDKNAFLEDLMNRVLGLTAERDEMTRKKEISEYTCSKLQEDLQVAQSEVGDMRKAMECNSFVLVLIDGDCMNFLDDFVRKGLNGGGDAARQLREAVFGYTKTALDQSFSHDSEIVIRVYANVEGLGKAYYNAKILSSPSQLETFVRGFNKTHPLCDFVDAGNDKEAADRKIIETMKLYFRNVHCKHIMLGGSADNSYTGVLRTYMSTVPVCSRITLLEGPPFAQSLEEIASSFLTTAFDHIFRKAGIMVTPISFREVRSIAPPKSPQHNSYASTVGGTGLMIGEVADVLLSRSVVTASPLDANRMAATKRIYRNRKGQRVDQPLFYDPAMVAILKRRKLCHKYYLSVCKFNNCTHDHTAKLTDSQLRTLRHIARLSPCWTIFCDDGNCTASHKCPQDPRCDRGNQCLWNSDMHNVDTKIFESTTIV